MPTPTSLSPQRVPKAASIRNLPINLFAAVMGIAGLALAWRQAGHQFGVSLLISEALGALAVLVFLVLAAGYLAKTIKYPGVVIGEFRHPVVGNFYGTIVISILMLSSVVAPLDQTLAEIVWTIGMIGTLALCFTIASRLLEGKIEIGNAVPAWFLPGVATLDIVAMGATMPMPWAHEVNMLALAVGSMIALLFFIMIMIRMIHHDPVPAPMVPSLMITMAPFEVAFLAYTNFVQHVDNFAGLLFYFGLFLFLVLLPKIFRGGIPFATGWWAIGFPVGALTSAALKYAVFAQAWPVAAIALTLLGMLSVAIAVLFVKTMRILVNGEMLGG